MTRLLFLLVGLAKEYALQRGDAIESLFCKIGVSL
jgi:hypothetical protein